jgi:hypothetical protein
LKKSTVRLKVLVEHLIDKEYNFEITNTQDYVVKLTNYPRILEIYLNQDMTVKYMASEASINPRKPFILKADREVDFLELSPVIEAFMRFKD